MTVKGSSTPAISAVSNTSHGIGSATNSPTIAYGTGTPATNHITGVSTSSNGTPTVGSMYIRTDGTAGARVYFYFANTWVAQTSP